MECGNCRGISLVTHAGNVPLKINTRRSSTYSESRRDTAGSATPLATTTIDHQHEVRRATAGNGATTGDPSLCTRAFVDLSMEHESVDRTLL